MDTSLYISICVVAIMLLICLYEFYKEGSLFFSLGTSAILICLALYVLINDEKKNVVGNKHLKFIQDIENKEVQSRLDLNNYTTQSSLSVVNDKKL